MSAQRILFIDDDELTCLVMDIVFREIKNIKDYKIMRSAISALEYLEAISARPAEFPDLILLDIRMPEMDGISFIQRYESGFFSNFPHTYISVVTNSLDENQKINVMKYKSVKRYINKPLSTEKVKNLL